jgi:hypothetical protein
VAAGQGALAAPDRPVHDPEAGEPL